MRGAPISIVGVIVLCLSCGSPRVAREEARLPDGSLAAGWTAVEGVEGAPALRAEIPWANGSALWGWGAMRMWGRPREDEVRVSAILDAPARARRWGASCEVHMQIDDRVLRTSAGYIGRPMVSGVYDAVRIDLGIEDLRAIAGARRVLGTVCGDRIEIGDEQRETVRRFVDQFDSLAVPTGPSRGIEILRGPDLVMPGDEWIWPTPA